MSSVVSGAETGVLPKRSPIPWDAIARLLDWVIPFTLVAVIIVGSTLVAAGLV